MKKGRRPFVDSGESANGEQVPSAERWVRIEALYHQALDVQPCDLGDFLEEREPQDRLIRDEVRAMVQALAEPPALLSRDCLLALEEDPACESVGERIGPYELLELLGVGGMGKVFRARRLGVDFEQEVALKLLALPSPRLQERFRQERQILASLSHPNIAQLLDGGITDTGIPFLAMEYVQGSDLMTYCNQRALTLEERLNLFEMVCAAVAFAHQNLVVHRDLKPSNILVAENGQVKLLDFGVARLLPRAQGQEGGAATNEGSAEPGERVELTPAWAAPELFLGKRATTAADVYSLGVVLYELLCGLRPYRTRGLSPSALEQVICHRSPASPSSCDLTAEIAKCRGTSKSRLRRSLRGNLDAIVLKSLHKGTQERYRSVNEMINDLQSHRQHFPVRARRPSWSLRTLSFLRRHATASAAVGLVLVSLTVGLVVALRGQAEARREALKSAAVADLLVGLIGLSKPDESAGAQLDVRRLLREGVLRLESESETSPEIRSELYRVLGGGYLSVGDYEDARELLGRSRAHGGLDASRSKESRIALLMHMGELDRWTSNLDSAETHYKTALDIADDLRATENNEVLATKAELKNGLGALMNTQGRYAEAIPLFREALELMRRLPQERAVQMNMARTLTNVAINESARGELEEAESHLRESLALQDNAMVSPHSYTATTLSTLAHLLRRKGELDEARPYYLQALGMRRELYGETHHLVAQSINNLGSFYYSLGERDKAEDHFQQAYEIWLQTLPENHPDLASALMNLSTLRERAGDLKSAIEGFSRALEMQRVLLRPDHPSVAYTQYRLARSLLASGKAEEALDHLRPAHDGLVAEWGKADVRAVRAQAQLVIALAETGSCQEAAAAIKDLPPSDEPGTQPEVGPDSLCWPELATLLETRIGP